MVHVDSFGNACTEETKSNDKRMSYTRHRYMSTSGTDEVFLNKRCIIAPDNFHNSQQSAAYLLYVDKQTP